MPRTDTPAPQQDTRRQLTVGLRPRDVAAGAADKLLVSMGQGAALLDVSEWTFKQMLYAGVIPSVKIGTRRLVRVADLEAYIGGLPPASP